MNKQNKYTITKEMAKKGIKVRTWAIAQGYSEKDITIIHKLISGSLKGKSGRAKEIKLRMIETGLWIEEAGA